MADPLWSRISELVARALELPAGERAAFIAREADDDPMREEVASLVNSASSGEDWLARLSDRIRLPRLAPTSPEPPMVGRRIGPWRLVELLGRGGMGTVYLAERADGTFEQQIALKLLSSPLLDSQGRRRFTAERQILARLEHPAIARLLDGGITDGGVPWFAMEYVEGRPITEGCDAARMAIAERLRLFLKVCEAVDYAHRRLVVHRDLKPGNVLVNPQGEVKLLDFGVAELLKVEARKGAEPHPVTPAYAAPEQLEGGPTTTATDVWALGVLLYELLTGERAQRVQGRSAAALVRVVVEQTPPPPSTAARTGEAAAAHAGARQSTAPELVRRLRGDLDAIVLVALRKDPERRYGSAAEMAEDVRRHLAALPVTARPDSLHYRVGKFVRRHALGLAAATAVALLTVGLVGFYTHSLKQERDRTEVQRRLAMSREVAVEAVDMLTIEPRLALALAMEAVELARSREAVAALRRALVAPIPRLELPVLAYDVTVDPTGKYAAVAGPGSTAGLWDLATGDLVHALDGHAGLTYTASFSPDGRLLLTTDTEGRVRIWDVTGGTLIHALRRKTLTNTAWSPDGRHVFTASNEALVRRWDVDTGHEVTSIQTPSRVRAVRVTSDGSSVIAWDPTASQVYVLDASTGDLLATLDGHETATVDIQSSPDGRHALSVGLDGTARIWDLHEGVEVAILGGFSTSLWVGRFSPDGTLVLVGDEEGNVRLAEVPSGRTRIDERVHLGAVVDAQFGPHGAVAVTVSADGTALVWDLEASRPREVLALNGAPMFYAGTRALAFTPDGKQVLTRGAAAEVWDVPPGPRMALRGHDPFAALQLTLSRDGALLATSGSDGILNLWDLENGEKRLTLEVPESRMRSSFSPDGSLLVTASLFLTPISGKTMPSPAIWDVATGTQVRSLPVPAPNLPSCAGVCQTNFVLFSPDGTTILTAGGEGVVRLWDAATGELLTSLEPVALSLREVSWSPDGQWIAASQMGGDVTVWDVSTGKLARELEASSIGVAFSPSSNLLAAVGYASSLWDVETGQRVADLRHASRLLRTAWSPDGRFLLTAGGDGAHLWDVASQRRLRSFTAHGTASSVTFTPDGAIVIGAEGAAFFYDCTVCGSVEELLETARRRSTRELTPLERQRFLHEAENRERSGGGGRHPAPDSHLTGEG